jgi:FkbH-like protein
MTCQLQRPVSRGNLAAVRRRLASEGAASALDELQSLLRRDGLAAEEYDGAGQLLRRIVRERTDLPALCWRLRIVGQCTTAWLANAVAAVAWREGLLLDTSEAPFDNVMQDLHGLAHAHSQEQLQLICLVPWLRNVESIGAAATDARVAAEEVFWHAAGQQCGAIGGRLIQVGCDSVQAGPAGFHLSGVCGNHAVARRLNEFMRRELPDGAYFVDLPLVAGHIGRQSFYDPRRFAWTRQPFSEAGSLLLAEHIVAAARALLIGPKKVLVLDLDNTLWGGVVGETGPLDVGLGESPEGEAYRQFQAYVKGLAERGVVLAVASKNNPADARGPFELNPGMILRLDDIAAFEAHWRPKAESLEQIAHTLNLGLDSFVFFDDNPAEREHIRQALPQVTVVSVPSEPADYARALEDGLWFETVKITDEDRQRVQQYQAEPQRQLLKQSSGSLDEYLFSLEMVARVGEIDDADLPRVVQLLGKTNQFNLTTRRHAAEDVRRLLATPRSVGFTVRLADRFGDYGLIAVILAAPEAENDREALVVDSWLMSCRVIGRSVEQFVCRELIRRARQQGFEQLVGVYVPTNKNQLVEGLYASLGFSPLVTDGDEGGRRWTLDIREDVSFSTLVRAA